MIRPGLAVLASLAIYLGIAPVSVWLALAAALLSLGSIAAMLGVVTREDRDLLRGMF